MNKKIAVVDFGGQYTHLIANRIRRLKVYSEIIPPSLPLEKMKQYRGIVFSGSPFSVLAEKKPEIDAVVLRLGIPVLGLCYGHQMIASLMGGEVSRGQGREYGKAEMTVRESPLFRNIKGRQQIWMSHGDMVKKPAPGFNVIGSTQECENAAVENPEKKIYGLQFHPEVTDTPCGMQLLENFIDICGCERNWNTDAFLSEINRDIREKCGNRNVFLLVSGGVDSAVAFALLNEALGSDRVLGLHVDNGLMRKSESELVIGYLKKHGFDNLKIYNARDEFLKILEGVSDPERKRELIGTEFVYVKERAEKELGLDKEHWMLAQGTIYPDTIESAGTEHADRIKTHHNRVDIILELIEKGLVIEPLSQLYKDEVRMLGLKLGLPEKIVWRHPFPGPGLGVRVLCSDGENVDIHRETQGAVSRISKRYGYEAVVLPVRSVGVQGDERSYAHPVLLYGPMDWDVLEEVSTQLTNSCRNINRVVYSLSGKIKEDYSLQESYITADRLEKIRTIDDIATRALRSAGEYRDVWQMPVVLLPLINSAGEECVVLRPVVSTEAMTATFARLKKETIETVLQGADNTEGIGPLFFDVTHKPPGTIEWE